MRLKRIKFNGHPNLGDLDLDFCDEYGNALNTIVLIGANGSGKTTILKNIFEMFNVTTTYNNSKNSVFSEVFLQEHVNYLNNDKILYDSLIKKGVYHIENTDKVAEINSKVVYMPTEINFSQLNSVNNTFKKTENFLNVIDQKMTSDIPSLIATKINTEIYKNRDLTIGQVIDKVCMDINNIFKILDLQVTLVGLSADETSQPIFKNHLGQEFDINDLSSGEKQLFLRALALKFLNVKDSIILIDEPEISLHPVWQSKIIQVYEQIGENNQIIIATHSPHVLSNIKAKQLRMINRGKDGVVAVSGNEKDETYGHTVESILVTTMGLDEVRNTDVTAKINQLRQMVQDGQFECDNFKQELKVLKEFLGEHDSDLMLIELEVRRQKMKKSSLR